MSFGLATVLGAVASIYIFVRALLHFTQDAREPPSIENTIPFVSPLIGMSTKKAAFYSTMRDKYNLPIYTLRMPGSRLYVVNATSLIPVVQRQFRALSFTAIESNIARDVGGVSKAAHEIIHRDLTLDKGYLMSFPKYIHSAVSAGPHLDAMNRKSVEVLADMLATLSKKGPVTVKMVEWIRHELLIATTDGVYGPKNPYRDPAMEDAWYKFESSIMTFVLMPYPHLLAKEAYEAREFMSKTWQRYLDEGWYKTGSKLVQARVQINDDFHVNREDTTKTEILGAIAILSNTIPATFWMTYHIFSDPVVLEDIRTELSKGVREIDGVCIIDMAHVTDACPILLSTFQEMTRYNNTGVSVRVAMEDHLLDGKYLIKKGGTVMIPGHVQHTIPSIWGENANEFYHKRFLRVPGKKRPNPIAFRGFGGGTTLCPGRHFATTEVLMFAALMVLRNDVRPVDGKWTRPSTDKSNPVAAMPAPDWDFDIELCPRDNKEWKISFSGHEKGMEISAEDIEGATENLGH